MNNRANYIRLATLALLWGGSFLFIKLGLRALAPSQVAFARIALGTTVLLILCAFQGARIAGFGSPEDRKLWRTITIAALFGNALPWTLFAIAEQTVSSGLTGVLNATTPLWTVLFGLLFGTERSLSGAGSTGLLVGFAGVVIILAPWTGGGVLGWGVLFCLMAAASYGIAFVYIGRGLNGARADGKKLSPLSLAAMQMSAAGMLTMIALPVGGMQPVDLAVAPVLAVATLGILGTGVAFAIQYRIISDEGATTASTVTYLIPIVSVLLGWLVLNEQFGWRVLIGMAVVLAGVALSKRQPRPRRDAQRVVATNRLDASGEQETPGSVEESCRA